MFKEVQFFWFCGPNHSGVVEGGKNEATDGRKIELEAREGIVETKDVLARAEREKVEKRV